MKKLYLEFIRGAAALTVLIYHFLELHTLSTHSNHFYFANWGTDAVIIFFILSGIVINISQSNNPKPAKEFMSNRLIRLYPLLIAGLVMGMLALVVTGSAMPTFGTIAGNLFMVSTLKGYMNNIVPCLESNSPLWSLSFEIIFYLIFALSIGRHQKRILLVWFILSLAVWPLYYLNIGNDVLKHIFAVMSFSSIWLVGYYIYEFKSYFYANKYAALFSAGALPLISRMHVAPLYYDPFKYLLFAIFAVPFFIYCLQEQRGKKEIKLVYLAVPYAAVIYIVFKQPYLTFAGFLAYAMLPLCLMAAFLIMELLKVKARTISGIGRSGGFLGRYSYAVYVTHYPVLFVCAAYFQNPLLYFSISIPSIFVIAYSLETYVQPVVVKFYKEFWLSRNGNTFGGRIKTLRAAD